MHVLYWGTWTVWIVSCCKSLEWLETGCLASRHQAYVFNKYTILYPRLSSTYTLLGLSQLSITRALWWHQPTGFSDPQSECLAHVQHQPAAPTLRVASGHHLGKLPLQPWTTVGMTCIHVDRPWSQSIQITDICLIKSLSKEWLVCGWPFIHIYAALVILLSINRS